MAASGLQKKVEPHEFSRFADAAILDGSHEFTIAKITKRPSFPTAAPDEEERRDSILQDEFSFVASPALRERRVVTQPSAASSEE